MKRLVAFLMLVVALVACVAPAGMNGTNTLTNTKVCSDLKPKPHPYDDPVEF